MQLCTDCGLVQDKSVFCPECGGDVKAMGDHDAHVVEWEYHMADKVFETVSRREALGGW